jgi:TonB-linked SusC/RagA family outer membrane protein
MFGLLITLSTFAQERRITGTILSEDDNRPLAGVTVTNRQTNRTVQTDVNGNYSIGAQTGQQLVFSFVGYGTHTVTVGANQSSVNYKMIQEEKQLEQVVVTAMDIKRNPKELGYSVQSVKGAELAETQRENFLNSLQGRIAGVTITPTSGLAGGSTQIVLRGFNSLSLSNSPLFIVDGVIVDNSTVNETSDGGKALGLASDRANRGNDYTSRISDINPNDIESVTVLKGPEATALYGSQASSGAIVITTKKGTNTGGRVGVSYDNSFRLSWLNRFPKSIDGYSGGTNGVPGDLFSYFGPAYATTGTPIFDNLHNFFRTGFSQTHNLSVDFGTKTATFRASGSLLNTQSPVPTNTYNRYTARLSNNTKIGKWLEFTPTVTYFRTTNDKPLRGSSGYLLNLLQWPGNNDIRNWQDANGYKVPLYAANPNLEIDNPFYNVYRNRSGDQSDRLIGTLGVNINPFDWLSVQGRFGYDTYKQDGYTRYDSASYFVTRTQRGYQDNYYRKYYGYNHTINATFKKQFGDFTPRVMIGTMWQDYETQQWAVSGSGLKDFSSSDSSNTDPATRIRLTNAKYGLPNYNISRQSAYFGEFSVGWKGAIFLTYSHRFEESSIFPTESRSYNYPAGSMSIVLSDLIPTLKAGVLNFWKIRGSMASTARSSAPYANQSVFNDNTGSGGGYYYGFTNNNPLLRPERQKTYEVGTELRFLNSRISLDATYYNTKNTDLIVEQFRASYGTGFVLNTLNVGANQNQGVEVAIDAGLIKNKAFSWNTRLNFNKMWNKVLELPANVPEFYQSDTWLAGNARGGLVVGGPTTTITSYGYQRNNAGQILISPTTGLPLIDQNFRVRGDRNPDFTLGWLNNMTYKNWRLSFLWDIKIGGDIFNATDWYITRLGKGYRSADRLSPRIVQGVLADGLENTAAPTPNNIVITPYFNQSYYSTMPEEEFIEKDVNWFRLRDITLNYTFPQTFVRKASFIRSLSAFVTANDLILITNYTGADPAVNGNTAGSRGVGGFGFDFGNIGAPISINFGIRTSF